MKITKYMKAISCSLLILGSHVVFAEARPDVKTPAVTDEQAQRKLMMAYRREFVFLDQEVRALKARQQELETLYVEKKSKSKVDIEVLEEKLLTLRDQIDMKMDLMTQKEEVIDEATGNADLVDVALTQMIVSLERYNIGKDIDLEKMKDGTEKLESIGSLFDDAFSVLRGLNDKKVEKGEFYDIEGKLLKGDIIRLGQGMAYGVSGEQGGVLAPAGMGKLMVWNGEGLDTAKSFLNETEPKQAYPSYLFEDINKKAIRIKDKTLEDVMEAGGVIGYVIIGLGLSALFLVVLRCFLLAMASSNSKKLVYTVGEMIKSEKKEEAQAFLSKQGGAAARVLEATVKHLHYKPSMLEDVIAESVLHETPRLEKFESAITVVAAVAPLLGLLGTVTGMISTFDVITIHGTGDPKMLSGGISEALVTTEMGLTVAIPLLLLGNLLSGWSEKIMSSIEHSALSVTNISRA